MSILFPKAPDLTRSRLEQPPACEWVMPAASVQRRDVARTWRMLPAGVPDQLDVLIAYSREGTEKCVTAVYGKNAYLIHYMFILPFGL